MNRTLIADWATLRREYVGKQHLAGEFVGYKPSAFHASAGKVLFVGKATRGCFDEPGVHRTTFREQQSAYWNFARRVARELNPDVPNYDNLAWSNIFKIGVCKGNPGTALRILQFDTAFASLRYELKAESLSLAIVAAANFGDDVVYKALNVVQGANDGFETVSEGGTEFYRRPPIDGFPAILWIPHPERKPREHLDSWFGTVCRMKRDGWL